MRNNLGRVNAHADVARLRAGLGARSAPSNVITLPTFEDAIAGRQRLHMVDAREYGASPSASAVSNTAAIQAALNDANGGALYLADGIYEISPTTGTIFALPGSVRIIGNGKGKTILRVADDVGAFDYVFVDTSHDVSGLTIADLTIDMNVDNNPIANLTEIMTHARYAVYLGSGATGSKITIENVEVKNNSSVNTIVTTAALSDVTVRGCTFIQKADPNAVAHDHSTLYLISTYNHISDNYFEGDALPATVSMAAIEPHGSHTLIADNFVRKYQIGMNVTGVSAIEDTTDVLILDNIFDDLSIGVIALWSYQYSGHTTGYGLDGVLIQGNVAHIKQTASAAGSNVFGVQVEPNSDLPTRNISIVDNTFIFELEDSDRTTNSAAFGIGCWSNTNMTAENWLIDNNTVVNMPCTGIRLSCGINNVRVSGNHLINCASTLHTAFAYRGGIMCYPYVLTGLKINDNYIADNNSTSRMVYGVAVAAPSTGTSKGAVVVDNEVVATGSTLTSLTYPFYFAYLAKVFARNKLPDGIDPYIYGTLSGSEYIDSSRSMRWVMHDEGGGYHIETWGSAAPTTGTWPRGSVCLNSSPSAGGAPGWVCVTAGTPGTWKAMANLAA